MVPLPLLVERLVAVRASGRSRSLLELGRTSPLWVLFHFDHLSCKGV